MNIDKLIKTLHPLEIKVLPLIKQHQELANLAKTSKLQEIEAMRGLQWLENKKAVKLTSLQKTEIKLGTNGLKYKKEGLPENKIFEALTEPKTLEELKNQLTLSNQELNASIGILKKEGSINIERKKELKISKTSKKHASNTSTFLKKNFPLILEKLNEQDKSLVKEIKKRKDLITIEKRKIVRITLTPIGEKIIKTGISNEETINRLTKTDINQRTWKNKNFRAYDVEINVPTKYIGKKHFVNEAIEYIKRIWLDMGFTEMTGNYIQTAFWDLDSLFVPQDHPAREMQDTFYLNGKGTLPPIWKKIKEVHETGGKTGSKGWGTKFSKKETQKLLLRTHTTVLSAQKLAKLQKKDLPAKFFAIGKVFRNEAPDWKHLFEFYQVEGIVIDPNANLKHLKGYLTKFYQKMGYSKVRMRPAHFPYTEPSLEVDVYHPIKKEWIELGGAGIFRPEVVKPLLGFDCTVLAWGQGMGRIISDYWKITDIRDLYKNDIEQIRKMNRWLL